MKPVKLEMTAFGPYKNTAVIDFGKLDNGVYAITGPTGAGKTTIFDAIMYALFGQVSCSGSKEADSNSYRSEKMIRSRFADPKTDTVVKFIFEEKSVKYTVIRRIHPVPSNPNPTPEVSLEGGGKSVSRQTQVNDEIKNILGGMDAVKFRQIVMLAQGQFKAFMEAKDDKRGEILREIFNAEMYLDMQNALSAIQKKIDGKKAELNKKLADRLRSDVFILPDDISDEVRLKYSPVLPSELLEKNLSELVENDRSAEQQHKEIIKNGEENIAKLNEKKGKAKETNELIENLEKAKKHKKELDCKADAMNKLEIDVKETEKAVHDVSGSYDIFIKTQQDKKRAEEELIKNRKMLDESVIKLGEAEEKNKEAEMLVEIVNKDKNKKKEYADNIGRFDDLKTAKEKYKKAENTKNTTDEKLKKESAENDKRKDILKSEKEEFISFENAEADREKRNNAYEKINEKYKLFDSKDGIISGFDDICKSEKNLDKLKQTRDKAFETANKSSLYFSDLSRKYYEGYAGKLGVKLEKDLIENGKAECPVCKSRFCLGDEHHFADMSDEIPTDEELKKAENENTDKKSLFDDAKSKYEKAEAALIEKQKAYILMMSDKLGFDLCTEWHKETVSDFINLAKTEVHTKLKKAESELEEADKKIEAKSNLKTVIENLEKQIGDSDKQIQSYREEITNAQKDTERYHADISRLIDEIKKAGMSDFESETAVKKAIEEIERNIDSNNAIIEEKRKNYDSAKQNKANLEGKVSTLNNQLKELQEQVKEKEKIFANKLSQAKFTDESVFLNAMSRAGSNPNEWISKRKDEIIDYHTDLQNTEEKIRELSEKNLKYVDLSELEKQISDLSDKKEKDTEVYNLIVKQKESHEAALKVLCENEKSLKKIENAYKRVSILADAAGGGRAQGGSHTFEGFVLGKTFREMLDISNKYLYDMTGGKYQFINDGSVRKGSEANYQISVQDSLSGSVRETGSLSGGESFQAAMALALGLSETVQSHNSSVNIDTMFIDEGFGSLDKDSLQRMLRVLSSISGGNRQIGIISHVDELKETITAEKKSVRVIQSKDREGSTLVIE